MSNKMLKVKGVYEKVLKEVTCNLRKVLNESVNSIKKVLKVLESAIKSPPAETPIVQKPITQLSKQIN